MTACNQVTPNDWKLNTFLTATNNIIAVNDRIVRNLDLNRELEAQLECIDAAAQIEEWRAEALPAPDPDLTRLAETYFDLIGEGFVLCGDGAFAEATAKIELAVAAFRRVVDWEP